MTFLLVGKNEVHARVEEFCVRDAGLKGKKHITHAKVDSADIASKDRLAQLNKEAGITNVFRPAEDGSVAHHKLNGQLNGETRNAV